MQPTPPLADRGARLVDRSPMPEYISEHFARADEPDRDHPDHSYIGLCIAENKLMWDLLEPQLNRNRHVQPASVAYGSMIGSVTLREQIAAFASEHVWGRTVDADHVIALAGAGTILEALFYVISDPGQGVLLPTPSYAGYAEIPHQPGACVKSERRVPWRDRGALFHLAPNGLTRIEGIFGGANVRKSSANWDLRDSALVAMAFPHGPSTAIFMP